MNQQPAYTQTVDRKNDTAGGVIQYPTVLILDASASMLAKDIRPSRLRATAEAAFRLCEIKAMDRKNDPVGIIAYSRRADVLRQLSPIQLAELYSAPDSCQALGGYRSNSSTSITAGLNAAESMLHLGTGNSFDQGLLSVLADMFIDRSASQQAQAHTHAGRATVVLLSDGCHNGLIQPDAVANRLKRNGACIHTVGVGQGAGLNEKLLRRLASMDENGCPRYCHITDQVELVEKFEQIAHHIRPLQATGRPGGGL